MVASISSVQVCMLVSSMRSSKENCVFVCHDRYMPGRAQPSKYKLYEINGRRRRTAWRHWWYETLRPFF